MYDVSYTDVKNNESKLKTKIFYKIVSSKIIKNQHSKFAMHPFLPIFSTQDFGEAFQIADRKLSYLPFFI